MQCLTLLNCAIPILTIPTCRLQGTDPIDILLCRSNGRVTGEAFVVFATYGELEIAMSRNKTYMGQRYVEVFQARKIVRTGGHLITDVNHHTWHVAVIGTFV